MKTIILFCVVLLNLSGVTAQNALEDFKKLSDTFTSLHAAIDVTYDMYSGHAGNRKIESMTAKYYVWERLLSYSMSDMDVYSNDRFSLSIDHESKNMVLNKTNSRFENKLITNLMKMELDSTLLQYSKFTLVNNTPAERTWRVQYTTPVGRIDFAEITMGPVDFRLQKIVLYYDASFEDIYGQAPENVSLMSKPRLEINYNHYTAVQKEDKDKYFYASEVMTVGKKGIVTVSEKYKKYHLANYYTLK